MPAWCQWFTMVKYTLSTLSRLAVLPSLALIRRLFHDPSAQAAIEQACAPIDGIPMLKAVLASITGELIWRAVRPPLRAADAATGARIAAMLGALEQRAAA